MMRHKAGLFFLSMAILLLWQLPAFSQDDQPLATPSGKRLITITATEKVPNVLEQEIVVEITYDVSGLSDLSDIEVAYRLPVDPALKVLYESGSLVGEELVWNQLVAPSGTFTTTLRITSAGAVSPLIHEARLRGYDEQIIEPYPVATTETELITEEPTLVPLPQLLELRLEPETSRAGELAEMIVVFPNVAEDGLVGNTIKISDQIGELEKRYTIEPGGNNELSLSIPVPDSWEDGEYELGVFLEDANGNTIAENEIVLLVRNPIEPESTIEAPTDAGVENNQSEQLNNKPTSEPLQPTITIPIEPLVEEQNAPGSEPKEGISPQLLWPLVLVVLLGVGTALFLLIRRQHSSGVTNPPSIAEDSRKKIYLTRSDTGDQILLTQLPYTIGRARENSLAIDDTFDEWQTISRNHAIISENPLGFVIEDLGSRNGIRVEGCLTPKNLLQDGWRIDIGKVSFTVQIMDESQVQTTNHGEHI